MASVRSVEPVVRFCGVITRHDAARLWAIDRIAAEWGPPRVTSEAIPFEAGGYYTPTMGDGLKKTLVAFDGWMDPAELADWKLQTNFNRCSGIVAVPEVKGSFTSVGVP